MSTKQIFAAVAASTAITTFAATVPNISGVTMAQSTSSRLVTITYNVDAEAVITLDIQTNYTENAETKWASIGGEAVWNAAGDVWKKVASGDHTITWRPDLSWPDHKIEGASARAVVTAWSLDNTPDYMVVNLALDKTADGFLTFFPGEAYLPKSDYAQAKAITGNPEYKTNKLVMRKILAQGVTWTFGSSAVETQRQDDSGNHRETAKAVTLNDNYYIGVFEVTQRQWQSVTNRTAITVRTSNFRANQCTGDMRPLDTVSRYPVRNTQSYLDDPPAGTFLAILRDLTGLNFDLPWDAQWEFAARAGWGSGYWGDGTAIQNSSADTNLDRLGRYNPEGSGNLPTDLTGTEDPATGGTANVGSYEPNDWGLYDMYGNVWEITLDSGSVITADGTPSTGGSSLALRGGSWCSPASYCRPAMRWNGNSNLFGSNYGFGNTATQCQQAIGFRLACPVGIQ